MNTNNSAMWVILQNNAVIVIVLGNIIQTPDRSGQPVVKRDTRHELKHGPVGCSSSNTRQLGCVFQDMEPPKLSILRQSSDMQKPIPTCEILKGYCASH